MKLIGVFLLFLGCIDVVMGFGVCIFESFRECSEVIEVFLTYRISCSIYGIKYLAHFDAPPEIAMDEAIRKDPEFRFAEVAVAVNINQHMADLRYVHFRMYVPEDQFPGMILTKWGWRCWSRIRTFWEAEDEIRFWKSTVRVLLLLWPGYRKLEWDLPLLLMDKKSLSGLKTP